MSPSVNKVQENVTSKDNYQLTIGTRLMSTGKAMFGLRNNYGIRCGKLLSFYDCSDSDTKLQISPTTV